MAEQTYTYSNEAFSGCDIVASILMPNINNRGNTVYTIGEIQTISYSIHMDRKPVRAIGNINVKDYVMGPRTIAGSLVFAVFNKHFANKIMKDIGKMVDSGYSFLLDEIPPFNIVISAANEYGLRSKLVIYGVRLVNEGQVMSINDVYTENTYQFVATDIDYLESENDYVSNASNNRNIYKIVEPDIGSYNNKLIFEYKKSEATSNVNIELKYRVRKPATINTKGLVELWTVPIKRTGIITLNSNSDTLKINVPDSVKPNGRIQLFLKPNTYAAKWSEGNLSSKEINLTVPYIEEEETQKSPAPIIEVVADKYINVLSNAIGHTKVVYEDSMNNRFTVKISGKRAILENLMPDSEYIIYTANELMTNFSEMAVVNTMKFGHSEYREFLYYLMDNKNELRDEDFENYSEALSIAESLSMNSKNLQTITDSFIEANKYYRKKLSELNTEDFTDLIKYQEAYDKLERLVNASLELITISLEITNDEIYGFNYEAMIVKQPLLIEPIKGIFEITSDIDKVEIYRHYGKTYRIDKAINSSNFYIEEERTYFIFNGKPGVKYFAYAINKSGYKSPRTEFYILNDDDKLKEIEVLENEKIESDYKLSKAKENIDNSFEDEVDESVLYEVATKSSDKFIYHPEIVETGNDFITVHLKESESVLNEEIKVVISSLDKSLKRSTKYKSAAEPIVTFTSKEHGLRKGESYLIWIECDGNQISDSILAKCETGYSSSPYLKNAIVSKIRSAFNKNDIKSNVVNAVLSKYEDDSESTKSNIIQNILKDISLDFNYIERAFDIVYIISQIFIDEKYSINDKFFSEEPIISKDKKSLIVNENCIMHKMSIYSGDLIESYFPVESNKVIDICKSEELYSIIYFVDKELNKVSGTLVVNHINEKYKTYNMLVKEEE